MGEAIYRDACANCHGDRWHEYAEEMFGEAYPDELDAVIGSLLSLNH